MTIQQQGVIIKPQSNKNTKHERNKAMTPRYNIEPLKKWLNKNGIPNEEQTFGHNYFENAQAVIGNGLIVTYYHDRTNPLTADTVLTRVIKYCKQYGYRVINNSWTPAYSCLWIVSGDLADDMELYAKFERLSVSECEQIAHEYHTKELRIDLNGEMKNIMEQYGAMYTNELRAREKAIA